MEPVLLIQIMFSFGLRIFLAIIGAWVTLCNNIIQPIAHLSYDGSAFEISSGKTDAILFATGIP